MKWDVSDLEKTIVDAVSKPHYAEGSSKLGKPYTTRKKEQISRNCFTIYPEIGVKPQNPHILQTGKHEEILLLTVTQPSGGFNNLI